MPGEAAAQRQVSEPEQVKENAHPWGDPVWVLVRQGLGAVSRMRAQHEQQEAAQGVGSGPRQTEEGSTLGVANVGC